MAEHLKRREQRATALRASKDPLGSAIATGLRTLSRKIYDPSAPPVFHPLQLFGLGNFLFARTAGLLSELAVHRQVDPGDFSQPGVFPSHGILAAPFLYPRRSLEKLLVAGLLPDVTAVYLRLCPTGVVHGTRHRLRHTVLVLKLFLLFFRIQFPLVALWIKRRDERGGRHEKSSPESL